MHSKKVRPQNEKGGRRKDPDHRAADLRLFKQVAAVTRVVTRRICTQTQLSTNGAGVIPVTTLASSNAVTAYNDFSNMAALYSGYRVKAFKITACPLFPVNTTVTVVPAWIAVIPFRNGLIPTTNAGFAESAGVIHSTGYGAKPKVFVTDSADYPDGKLWNPTNAVIASADSFGLAVMGQASPAATISLVVWYCLIESLIEFQVAG